MGLTAFSTGINSIDSFSTLNKDGFVIAIAGNPNVGKSTVFNGLTGMHQHTGNWPGKTVANACGNCKFKGQNFLFVDIPGTYSLMANSEEEEIARDFICFNKPDATVVVVDATCLERNLNLVYQTMELTNKVIVCVNLLDEAQKKGIYIDLKKLEDTLGVPVVGTVAKNKKSLNKLLSTIYNVIYGKTICEPKNITYNSNIENIISNLENSILNILPEKYSYNSRWIALKLLNGNKKIFDKIERNFNISLETLELDSFLNTINKKNISEQIISCIIRQSENVGHYVCKYSNSKGNTEKFDKILTSKIWGIPIMLLFLGIIFWITLVGANYPSEILSNFFTIIQQNLLKLFTYLHMPWWITDMLINGLYQTLTWIIAVMLPPMAIFFPLFTLLEDLGVLPRIAFNLDKCFKNACTSGKQALTMCMGFGCNAARNCWYKNYRFP